MTYFKRFVLFPVVIFAVLALVVGCQKSRNTAGMTTIEFIDFGSSDEVARMDDLIKQFESKHPGVKINVEYTKEVRQKILYRAVGNVPLDIVSLNDTAYPEFVKKKVFEPLDGYIKNDKGLDAKDFLPTALKCATFDGKVYSIPPFYGTIVCLYNKDLFKKAGFPYPKEGWTWDEFRAMCKKLTIPGHNNGMDTQFGSAGIGFWDITQMMLQYGGRIADENGKCVLDSPQNLAALQFVKDMYTKDKTVVSSSTMPGAFSGSAEPTMDSAQLFATGRMATAFAGLDITSTLPKNIDWDFVPLPEKKGRTKFFHGGFWGYAIASRSTHKEITWEFLKFLVSRETEKYILQGIKSGKWAVNGATSGLGAPSRISLKDDFQALYPGKNMHSYYYSLQYPDFQLAQAWGSAEVSEAMTKDPLAENLMGQTNDSLSVYLKRVTESANSKARNGK